MKQSNKLFDARSGFWAGSGFFSDRFASNELVQASATQVREDFTTASWPGFRTGPAAAVSRAAQQSRCEQIAGLRICPREEAFSARESEYYRKGVGALAYSFDFSASFSGGGFFSSSTTKERLGLVATSLRGDTAPPAKSDEPAAGSLVETEPNDTEAQARMVASMIPHIVAFEIPISRLEGKFKLSQNRDQADRDRVIARLDAAEAAPDRVLAALMKESAEQS